MTNHLEHLRTVDDYERECRRVVAPDDFHFRYGERNAPDWVTYTRNLAAFDAIRLRPRVLTGLSDPSLSTSLLGTAVSMPIVVGPTGNIPGAGGEVSVAAATKAADTLLVLSSVPGMSTEDIAAAAGRWWQQVFVFRERAITEWQVRRAVEFGARALVLTVSNTGDTLYRQHAPRLTIANSVPPEPLRHFPAELFEPGLGLDAGVSWPDVEWLRSLSDLPVVVKGIQTAEDARLCLDHGVAGIVVSNHGGRFAEGVRGTMEALPEIVDAVEGRIEVSIDGGVRHGYDVLKALALGARTVWLGRATLWGHTVGGQAGVEAVLDILRSELRSTMALCGVADVTAVDRSVVAS